MKRYWFFIIAGLIVISLAVGWFFYSKNKVCGVENCHGLEIQCGSKIARACTEEYQIGDICRQFAACARENGACKQVINDNFSKCSDCVNSCNNQFQNDPEKLFTCESKCASPTTGNQNQNQTIQQFEFPIKNYFANQTKKVFGQFITPQNSPVQPERFHGYHTGVDIEVSPADLNRNVRVYALADGKVIYLNWVSGYGGVIIIQFTFKNQTYTALYGHLKIASAKVKVGDNIWRGQEIAILGKAYSTETDGERKHLHFSIHKGSNIELRGYVQQKSQLSAWIDPNSLYQK